MFTGTIMGYIGRDIEMRGAVGNFSIKMTQGVGEYRKTVFVDCKAFAKTAERIREQFTKGTPIVANGRIEVEEWDDKTTGQKRSKQVLIVSDAHFVVRDSGERQSSPPAQPAQGGGFDANADLPF